MHRELVEKRRWVSDDVFMRGLNFCMLLPGPEAQQLATYVGWRLHGVVGAIAAGALFIVPSIFVLLGLAWLVAEHGDVALVSALLYGVQPVVVGLVIDAVIRVGRRAIRHRVLAAFALAAFVALQASVPFPIVVLAALAGGALMRPIAPAAFGALRDPSTPPSERSYRGSEVARSLRTVAIFVLLWAIPFAVLVAWSGPRDVIVREALFFTQAAFLTFGGAYAVLAYVADAVVRDFNWLSSAEMVQGLGLAESTPGPLIMVTQYVGFLAAWKLHPEAPLLYGTIGALVTTYVTFLPSFMFILAGAPYVERIAAMARARAALVGVTSAVVGVIAHLAAFFGSSVLLAGGRVDAFALVVALVSLALLRRTSVPVPALVVAGAAVGAGWRLFG